jgi:hypothetical protein
MKVWRLVSGPYHRNEIGDDELPEELEYMIVALVEREGELYDQEFWFESFDEAMVWVMHFKSKIEPIEVNDAVLSDVGEN